MAAEFENDIASRYGEQVPHVTPTGPSWREREAQLQSQISNDPNQSCASMVWNFDSTYGTTLEGLVRAGKYAEAKQYRDDLSKMIENNREGIGQLITLGDIGGATSADLAKRARSVFNYEFDSREIDMPDGSKATIRQILDPESQYMAVKSRELADLGFNDASAAMFTQGSDAQRRTVGRIMKPFLQTRGPGQVSGRMQMPSNHQQMIDLANDVGNNWDTLEGVFGDGVENFVDFIQRSHASSGCASASMRSLANLANLVKADTGLEGKELANKVVSDYENLLGHAFSGDDQKAGATQQFSDNQRRLLDAILIPSIREVSRRGGSMDLAGAGVRDAVKKITDLNARMSAAGMDLIATPRNSAFDINGAFAGYVADRLTGASGTDNVVDQLDTLYRELDRRVYGGYDPVEVPSDLTGQSKDYMRSVTRANKTESMNPVADAMSLDTKNFVVRSLFPHLLQGKTADQALSDVMNGTQEARGAFLSDLAQRFLPYFHGKGSLGAAQFMADQMVRTVMSGNKAGVQELVEQAVTNPDAFAGDPDAFQSLSTWYNGNVVKATMFAKDREDLMTHYLRQGFSDHMARRHVSRAVSEAASLISKGVDGGAALRARLKVGRMLFPMGLDENKVPVIESTITDLSRTGFQYVDPNSNLPLVMSAGDYMNNPTEWDQAQKVLAELKTRYDAVREAQRKSKENEAAQIRKEERKKIADYEKEQIKAGLGDRDEHGQFRSYGS